MSAGWSVRDDQKCFRSSGQAHIRMHARMHTESSSASVRVCVCISRSARTADIKLKCINLRVHATVQRGSRVRPAAGPAGQLVARRCCPRTIGMPCSRTLVYASERVCNKRAGQVLCWDSGECQRAVFLSLNISCRWGSSSSKHCAELANAECPSTYVPSTLSEVGLGRNYNSLAVFAQIWRHCFCVVNTSSI